MDFQFLQDPVSKKWISLSPRRAKRPNSAEATSGKLDEAIEICPFCPGNEKEQPSVYEVKSQISNPKSQISSNNQNRTNPLTVDLELGTWDLEPDWLVRVIPNKFPFAPIHEVIIHSGDHHKSFGELPTSHTELIFKTYRQQYNKHKEKGHVIIFANSGEGSGESLPHPHSQLAVLPLEVTVDMAAYEIADEMFIDAGLFRLGTPATAQWPDEVWFVPKETNKTFGEISDAEITSLSDGMDRLVKLYSHRYGHEFPFNFFIRPGIDWYLRLIPRVKTLGGFEFATGVYVNTHDPKETVAFLQEHWENPDFEKIKTRHQAEYDRHA